MSNPFRKIKRAVKKGAKKIKKGLGSLANRVADKLIPKELAPFLPALAPLFLGPQASLLTRYLAPQILTALSTGKTQGDIDLTSQALTGIASALSDPRRFELATPTEAQAAVEGASLGPDKVGFGQIDPATGEFVFPEGGEFMLNPDGSVMTVDQLPKSTIVDGVPMNVIDAGTSNLVAVDPVGYGAGQVDPAFAQAIGSGSPAVPAQPLTRVDTGLNALKTAANKTLDFMQGLNEATKFGEPVLDAAGNPVLVRDAGFFRNLPRRTIQQGILSAGPIMASIEKSEEEQAAMLAEQQAEQQAGLDARNALTDFYFGLADPQNRFGTLPIFAAEGGIMNAAPGMPEGMQVDGRNGTFIPMGVKEKADDVPAMLSKNEFVMTADAVRAMGEGDVNKGAQRMYDLMNNLEARV